MAPRLLSLLRPVVAPPVAALLTVGWKEWAYLPDLSPDRRVKAKIDTGAATSALHAEELEFFERDGSQWCRFLFLPRQGSAKNGVAVERVVADRRVVRSSNGFSEERPVVTTDLVLADQRWPIEVTLTNRDLMGFRLLIGRSALRGRAVVDVDGAYLATPIDNVRPIEAGLRAVPAPR